MSDPADEETGATGEDAATGSDAEADTATDASGGDDQSREELRREVEEKYDFENFGPRDMKEMSAEEWDAAFDPDSWVTGTELLDRVEADLRRRIAERDVFAVVDREVEDGEEVLVAYADEGYAVVYPDGSVEGSGTVLRDVKPTVALCSMPEYDVEEPPEDAGLPSPQDVPEGTGSIGHLLLQTIAFAQLGFGALLVLAPVIYDPIVRGCPAVPGSTAHVCSVLGTDLVLHPLGSSAIIAVLAGVGFIAFGVFMLVVVANARLSDRFRAEEFRERLRASGVGDEDRPAVHAGDDREN